MPIIELGFDSWFEDQAKGLCSLNHPLARVIAVDRGAFIVNDGDKEFSAAVLRKFIQATESAADFPCVGDWVCIEHHNADNFPTIHHILPRKTLLRRKTAGEEIKPQMLGANIDVAFIVQSCHLDFNMRRLERYLVMINEGHIEPVLLLTKTDLITPEKLLHMIAEIRHAGINNKIIALSNVSGDGLEQLRKSIEARKTYCLLGSSGVGKTTIINQLIGKPVFETQTVSSTGEGRHTTVRRYLTKLENGAMFIDMPGIRELGIASADEGIETSFTDILDLAQQCRFSNCTHSNEPGCAILQAIANNEMDQGHYRNYLKLKKESESNEKSYLAKQRKVKNNSRANPIKTKHKKKY